MLEGLVGRRGHPDHAHNLPHSQLGRRHGEGVASGSNGGSLSDYPQSRSGKFRIGGMVIINRRDTYMQVAIKVTGHCRLMVQLGAGIASPQDNQWPGSGRDAWYSWGSRGC